MNEEYKYSEDNSLQNQKSDTFIDPISKKMVNDPNQFFFLLNEQFHNSRPSDLSYLFQYAYDFIEGFQDQDLLINVLSKSPIGIDLTHYFNDICQIQDEYLAIPNSFFQLIYIITRISSLFSDDPKYLPFIFLMIENFKRINNQENQQHLINIINNIIFSSQDKDFLNNFYNSQYHFTILRIALEPNDITDKFSNIKNGAQLIIKNLYKNSLVSNNNPSIAEQILKEYFKILDEYNYYDDKYNNESFIIDISYVVINTFPQTYKIIYNDHEPYFHHLFFYINTKSSYFAFRLITLIIQNLPREEPPDLDDDIDWNVILNFFSNKERDESKLKMMLGFSAAYLKFGSAFFYKFLINNFFDKLLEIMLNGSLPFSTYIYATNCLINAIIFSAQSQVFELFQRGALPALLFALENDSDEDFTSGILTSIQRIWEVCENSGWKSEKGLSAVDEFTICFSNECGYKILSDLSTCADQAQHLSDKISDPPNM